MYNACIQNTNLDLEAEPFKLTQCSPMGVGIYFSSNKKL